MNRGDQEQVTRFDWERAVIGENGPRNPTTRLVLLALATHVPRGRAHAWPSTRMLELETGLSRLSVMDQLKAAKAGGWLRCEFTRLAGMRYRGNVYHLAVPIGGQRDSPVVQSGSGQRRLPEKPSGKPSGSSGQPGASSGQPGASSGQRRICQVGNVASPYFSVEQKEEQRSSEQEAKKTAGINPVDGTDKGKTTAPSNAAERSRSETDLTQWATEHGISQGIGENEDAFKRRASWAYTTWKAQQCRAPE